MKVVFYCVKKSCKISPTVLSIICLFACSADFYCLIYNKTPLKIVNIYEKENLQES